jgi:heat shock 70kDa protein 1/2/6/8
LCVADFKKKFGVDVTGNPRAIRRLKEQAQKAKHFLSSSIETEIAIPDLAEGKDLSFKLSRAKFEKACKKRFDQAMDPVRDVIKSAAIEKDEIDEIILIGGSTRIPKIQELLQAEFNGKKLNTEVNPDEAVAIGAAIQGAILAPFQKDRILDDEIKAKGFNLSSTQQIIQDQISVDKIKSKPEPEPEPEPEEEEEPVQLNPALEKLQNITLIDVTPLSLGIAVGKEDRMSVIIAKNSAIPIKKKKIYTTLYDNQKEVTIPVYQGENHLVKDNHFLGQFQLKNIPLAKAGVPRFDTVFEIDANGILQVSAQLHGSQDIYKIVIEKQLNMKEDDIEKSIINTKSILKDKKTQQLISKKAMVLSDLATDIAEKDGTDPALIKIAEQIAEWCDDEASNASLAELEKKQKEFELAYHKYTGKTLKIFGDDFDDVDADLLN